MKASEIRDWIEHTTDLQNDWVIEDGLLDLTLGTHGIRLVLSEKDITALDSGRFPKKRNIKVVPHCGIELEGYAEYLIEGDGWGPWPGDKPLQFRIGDTLVRVGGISEALALIFESIYRSKDYFQLEFLDSYATLQLEGSTSPKEDAAIALFYLNTFYLRPIKSSVDIHHLVDPSAPDPFPYIDKPERIVRARIRTRDKITLIEPVALFNAAASDWGDAKFLGFYRVLEFFFRRGAIAEIGRMRRDSSISDAELLENSRLEQELPQLQALCRNVLTKSEQRKLLEYVSHHSLAVVRDVDAMAKAIYKYRNTLVHAKETEIGRTKVPDPFDISSTKGSWNWVVEILAERSIRRLGK